MRTWIAAVATTVASVAFQISVAVWPNLLQQHAGWVKYLWLISGGFWLVWFVSHPRIHSLISGDPPLPPVPPLPADPPHLESSDGEPLSASPIRRPTPRLVASKPTVSPVGYDIYGVWKVWQGDLEAILLEIRNDPGEQGTVVAAAEDLVVNISAEYASINRPSVVSRAFWLGHQLNEIDLEPGEKCSALLAVRRHDILDFYENPKKTAPIYVGRRPFPRVMPQFYPTSSIATAGGVTLTVHVLDSGNGLTLLSKVIHCEVVGDSFSVVEEA